MQKRIELWQSELNEFCLERIAFVIHELQLEKSVAKLFYCICRRRHAKLPFHVDKLTYHKTLCGGCFFKRGQMFFPLKNKQNNPFKCSLINVIILLAQV